MIVTSQIPTIIEFFNWFLLKQGKKSGPKKLQQITVSLKTPHIKTFKVGLFSNLSVSPPNYFLIDHHSAFFCVCEGEIFMEVVTEQLLFPLTNS